MIFEVYKMYPKIVQGHVFMGTRAPELKLEIDTQNMHFLEYMYENDNLNLIPDVYYIVNKERTEYYMLWNEYGYWCFDGASYQDRLVIATELDLTRNQARVWNEVDDIQYDYSQGLKKESAYEKLMKVFPEYV